MAEDPGVKVLLFLLKTKSVPTDTYEDYFSTFENRQYDPVFVPVLEHRFNQDALAEVRNCITKRGFVSGPSQAYGAVIFTSQRAVEAFCQIIEELRQDASVSLDELIPSTVPFYAVGPATARGLRAIGLAAPVLGEESGTGEVLADFILEHYNSLHQTGLPKPPILFLVGDKRRDIIPKKVQSPDLSAERRGKIVELVIYETGEMHSFQSEFSALLEGSKASGVKQQWVVVFSPTGCKAMLDSLEVLDKVTGKVISGTRPKGIMVATIGPTTRDYLMNEFNFVPDACAETPSAEGVGQAIRAVL